MFTFKNSDHFLVVLAKVFVKGWDRSRALIFPPPPIPRTEQQLNSDPV